LSSPREGERGGRKKKKRRRCRPDHSRGGELRDREKKKKKKNSWPGWNWSGPATAKMSAKKKKRGRKGERGKILFLSHRAVGRMSAKGRGGKKKELVAVARFDDEKRKRGKREASLEHVSTRRKGEGGKRGKKRRRVAVGSKAVILTQQPGRPRGEKRRKRGGRTFTPPLTTEKGG